MLPILFHNLYPQAWQLGGKHVYFEMNSIDENYILIQGTERLSTPPFCPANFRWGNPIFSAELEQTAMAIKGLLFVPI